MWLLSLLSLTLCDKKSATDDYVAEKQIRHSASFFNASCFKTHTFIGEFTLFSALSRNHVLWRENSKCILPLCNITLHYNVTLWKTVRSVEALAQPQPPFAPISVCANDSRYMKAVLPDYNKTLLGMKKKQPICANHHRVRRIGIARLLINPCWD